mmetsp:Transcript_73659/g.191335  ORF Transcript_73659/g.191335 Transcript_73659/m.191335 type:complete len:211 (-) Transcript_73659:595-1227(-)
MLALRSMRRCQGCCPQRHPRLALRAESRAMISWQSRYPRKRHRHTLMILLVAIPEQRPPRLLSSSRRRCYQQRRRHHRSTWAERVPVRLGETYQQRRRHHRSTWAERVSVRLGETCQQRRHPIMIPAILVTSHQQKHTLPVRLKRRRLRFQPRPCKARRRLRRCSHHRLLTPLQMPRLHSCCRSRHPQMLHRSSRGRRKHHHPVPICRSL